MNNLELLFRGTPYPTDDTLKAWTHHLGLTFEFVRDSVHAQRISLDSRELHHDYQAKDRGPVQDHTPLTKPYRPFFTKTDVSVLNEPFPLPPAFVPPKALPPRLILKLKPVDQNRCLLFDIAERMDLDDPPTTYANAAEPGTCDLDQPPSELQPQEASPKTMTRELFLNSFRPTETKMMRLMDQVGKGALDTEGYHKAFIPERFQVAATSAL